MTAFHDVRLPIKLALGTQGGPQRRTEIATLASGREVRIAVWAGSRRRWEIGSAITDLASLQALMAFFEARCGRLYGFRFRDPLDHSSAMPGQAPGPLDQHCAYADGLTTVFQLYKHYGEQRRLISKPVSGTVRVAVDQIEQLTGWHLDPQTGEIHFEEAPAEASEITAGYEYDCAVRFDNDQFTVLIDAVNAGRAVSLSLIELL